MSTDDQRAFVRSETHFPSTLAVEGRAPMVARTRDVSLSGVFLDLDDADRAAVPDGTEAALEILLTETVRIALEGHIVRHEARGVALHIDAIPIDSFEHLRQLVLRNSHEPDTLLEQLEQRIRR